jgi:hypothetical protein
VVPPLTLLIAVIMPGSILPATLALTMLLHVMEIQQPGHSPLQSINALGEANAKGATT